MRKIILPALVVLLAGAVDDAAVSALGRLPVRTQLEILVLLIGHEIGAQVTAVIALCAGRLESAILDDPRLAILAVVAVPSGQSLAVEKQLPTGRLFLG